MALPFCPQQDINNYELFQEFIAFTCTSVKFSVQYA